MNRKRGTGRGSDPKDFSLSGYSMLPWLLIGLGAFSNLFQPETPNPVIGGLGLLAFNSLYIYVVFRSFLRETRESTSNRLALALLTLITCALALGYGGAWLLFFPLLGLATGAVIRLPHLRWASLAVTALAGTVGVVRNGWGGLDTAYATWISTLVTAAVLSLADTVRELRSAREELARRAVEKERLRFSRDLHDLLGHTLSVIVVKSEAARRLAPRNMDAALVQITDIESVGRQALTEIREAVTGYRESSFTTELDRSRSTLTTAGITPTITESGPPLSPQTAALLGWVVRESVTNIVRHSGATHCAIALTGTADRVRLTVTDDGPLPKGDRAERVAGALGTGGRGAEALGTGEQDTGGQGGSAPGTGGQGDKAPAMWAPAVKPEGPGPDADTSASPAAGAPDTSGTTVSAPGTPATTDRPGVSGTAPSTPGTSVTADAGLSAPGASAPAGTAPSTAGTSADPGTDPATPITPPTPSTGPSTTRTPSTPSAAPSTLRTPPTPDTDPATPHPSTTPTPTPTSPDTARGTGLIGLRERLAAVGGTLEAGPGARGGFTVTAELPAEAEDYGATPRRDPVHGAGSVDGWHPEPCAPGVYTVRPAPEVRHSEPSSGPGPRLAP